MIERIIYECEHCHKRKLMNKSKMKQHENICWYNPKNHTCVTCKFGEIGEDSCDHPELDGCPTERWMYRACNHPDRITDLEGVKPKVNCLMWEEREE